MHFGATECDLINNVAEGFPSNRGESAMRTDSLSYESSIEMSCDGWGLVEREALETPLAASLDIRIRGVHWPDNATVIGPAVSGESRKREAVAKGSAAATQTGSAR